MLFACSMLKDRSCHEHNLVLDPDINLIVFSETGHYFGTKAQHTV